MSRPKQGYCFYCKLQKEGYFTARLKKVDPEDVYNQLETAGLVSSPICQPTEQQLSGILLPMSDNFKADILNNLERKMVSSSINSSGRQLWSVFSCPQAGNSDV